MSVIMNHAVDRESHQWCTWNRCGPHCRETPLLLCMRKRSHSSHLEGNTFMVGYEVLAQQKLANWSFLSNCSYIMQWH